MTALAEAISPAPRIAARPLDGPILFSPDRSALLIRPGTVLQVDGRTVSFTEDTPVRLPDPTAGHDYVVDIDDNGGAYATDTADNIPHGHAVAGFHFAPGGNAAARAGGDDVPAINPYSLWDIGFRPSCNPRGMTLVTMPDGRRVWVDIYLLGKNHKEDGTSRFGVKIADGWSLDTLDFGTASEIMTSHGKRLLAYDEFKAAAYGVTERSSAVRDPDVTGLDAARTSQFGLMQATGNAWIWGTDGDPENPAPSFFGGSWLSGDFAGSRYADLDCWPDNSHDNISARGACDHLTPA